jgi:hypothetical protein
MATANHSRQSRSRARAGANRHRKALAPSPKELATVAGSRQRVSIDPRPDLDALLGRFSDAIAFVETASHALDAAEESGPSAPLAELATLRYGLEAVQRVYTELDLAILALGRRDTPI